MNRALRSLVLAVLFLMLAAPLGSAADKLVIWDKAEYIPYYNEFMRQFSQQWGRENGVEVEYTVIPPADLITKLMAAVESGNVPDISTVEVNMVAQLAGMGATAVTNDLIAEIERRNNDQFTPGALRLVSIDGVY